MLRVEHGFRLLTPVGIYYGLSDFFAPFCLQSHPEWVPLDLALNAICIHRHAHRSFFIYSDICLLLWQNLRGTRYFMGRGLDSCCPISHFLQAPQRKVDFPFPHMHFLSDLGSTLVSSFPLIFNVLMFILICLYSVFEWQQETSFVSVLSQAYSLLKC